MNAIIREEYEAPVLTNEAIEVHLNYLRPGLDSVQAALPVLRDKIDRLSDKVDSKFDQMNTKIEALGEKTNARINEFNTSLGARIDQVSSSLGARIEQVNISLSARIEEVNTSLSAKIDKSNDQRAAGDAALGEKIEKLTEVVLKNQGRWTAMLWVLSLSGAAGAATSIAHTLGWI
jgi:DNA anti-recombination protein RmuC